MKHITTAPLKQSHLPKCALNAKKIKGFTLVELIAVIAIGGLMAAAAATYFSDAYKLGDVSYLSSTADRLNQNWRLATNKCNVSSQVGASTMTTPATAAANLTLLVEGTLFTPALQGCWNSTGVEPARSAGIRGSAGAYTAQGYTITIKNVVVDTRNRMGVTFAAVDEPTVLELIQKYGGQSNASNMITIPTAADTADKKVQYSVATGGNRDVTLIQ